MPSFVSISLPLTVPRPLCARVAPTISSCAQTHRYTSIVLNLLVRMNTPYSCLDNLGAFAVYREGARRERDSFLYSARPISNHSCDASVNAASHFCKIQCAPRLSLVYLLASDFLVSCRGGTSVRPLGFAVL